MAPRVCRWLRLVVGLLALGGLSGCGGDPKPDGFASDGGAEIPIDASGELETECNDGADNDGDGHTDCNDADCRLSESRCELAPALDRSVASTVSESAAFLYSG